MEQIHPIAPHFKKLNLFSDDEISFICNHFEKETIPANHYFLKAGQKCSKIGFLVHGILASYIIGDDGEMAVKHFIQKPSFFTDLDNFQKQSVAFLNIKAMVDSDIYFITRKNNDKLCRYNANWLKVMGIFSSEALKEMVLMQNFLYFGTAAEKYNHFVKNYPQLAQQVPLKYIAAYLGVTQSSLSRIRREG